MKYFFIFFGFFLFASCEEIKPIQKISEVTVAAMPQNYRIPVDTFCLQPPVANRIVSYDRYSDADGISKGDTLVIATRDGISYFLVSKK